MKIQYVPDHRLRLISGAAPTHAERGARLSILIFHSSSSPLHQYYHHHSRHRRYHHPRLHRCNHVEPFSLFVPNTPFPQSILSAING